MKKQRNILVPFLALVFVILAARLVSCQLQQDAGLRKLVAVVDRLPEAERLNPIPCSRAPLVDGSEKIALQQALLRLAQPAWRAVAYCLLGDYSSALAVYEESATGGDTGSNLQIYFLQARLGNMPAANEALGRVHFSKTELQKFYFNVINTKIAIDLLPLAQRMAELYPADTISWQAWRDAAKDYEHSSHWQAALDAYLDAIQAQQKLGVSIGRSSFELSAGRIYQTRIVPTDLKKALSFYNAAIADMDFLEAAESSSAYLYRGEVYQGLRPAYTISQALQEFLQSLNLDPKNYWAMRAIAGVYLYDMKDLPSAEFYINQAISLYPDLYYAYLIRGDIYYQQGDLQSSVNAYQDALARQPGYEPALDRLAVVQAELQKKAP